MKRIFTTALALLLALSLSACGDSSKAIEGTWYSIPDTTMFSFEEGKVSCSGQTVGQYEQDGKSIILSLLAGAENLQLYAGKSGKIDVLTDAANGDGNIYFCRGLENAQQLVEEAARFKIPEAELVTYDSLVAGEHAGETVATEAVVVSLEYIDYMNWYEMVLAFWSDKEQEYIYKNDLGLDDTWTIKVYDHHQDAVAQLKTFDEDDKIRLIHTVYDDGSFGATGYVWAELIEKDYMSIK